MSLVAAVCATNAQALPGDTAPTAAAGSAQFNPPPAPTPVTGRAQLTASELEALRQQRIAAGLADVPADQLLQTTTEWQLYAKYGTALMPDEAAGWAARDARASQLHDVFEKVGDDAGLVEAGVDPSGVIQVWTSTSDASKWTAALGALPNTTVATVSFDRTSLTTARDAAVKALTSDELAHVASITFSHLGLAIGIDQTYAARDSLASRVRAAVAGRVPVAITFTSLKSWNLLRCPDKSRCGPYEGGNAVMATELFNQPFCSTNFAYSQNNTLNIGIGTAGHCNDHPPGLGSSRDDSVNYPLGTTSAWSMPARLFSSSADFAIMYQSAENWMINGTYFRDLANRRQVLVSGYTQTLPPNQTRVCISGMKSNVFRCGTIQNNHYTYGQEVNDQIDILMDPDNGILHGDSGGSVVVQTSPYIAVGSVVAGACPCDPSPPDDPHFRDVVVTPTTKSYATGWSLMYAPQNINSRAFLMEAYDSGLLRPSDASGLNYWVGYLSTSCSSRIGTVVYNFMTAAELTNARPLNSVANINARMRRLYWTAMDRDPVDSELSYWTSVIQSGGSTETSWQNVINYFLASSEFANRVAYGPSSGQAGLPAPCP